MASSTSFRERKCHLSLSLSLFAFKCLWPPSKASSLLLVLVNLSIHLFKIASFLRIKKESDASSNLKSSRGFKLLSSS
ncbi:hypothetical protein L2E82_47479 [Cichorium intybus]|uniref:Uncharacterized protein n=1 Tax=Cichorium intybus TaxID=13427 RepID=A0ACB8YUU8_CICIN|nr:hypothetical protein L2E82_47479 [Cichorium intybus]